MKTIDMTGKRFGRLLVLSRAENTPKGWAQWLCRCDCGNEKVIVGTSLTRKRPTQSCGCRHRDVCIERSTKHGHATQGISPTYHSWSSMVARCTNPNNARYASYMGRGITVDPRWLEFETFLADMGEKPDGTSLGRIDNNKGYYPKNCRWETQKQQQRNRRNNRILELDGVSRTVAEWAEHLGVPVQRLHNRLHYGWSVKRTLSP